jgi:hypothetical protein
VDIFTILPEMIPESDSTGGENQKKNIVSNITASHSHIGYNKLLQVTKLLTITFVNNFCDFSTN